jgi:hypothetical protein
VFNKLYELSIPPKPPISAGNEDKIIRETDKPVRETKYLYGAGQNPVDMVQCKSGDLIFFTDNDGQQLLER